MSILNLTQHNATKDQVLAGVVEPENKQEVLDLITFSDTPPSLEELDRRAERLAFIALHSGCQQAMIGGAPYFSAPLEYHLSIKGVTPVYAFSNRVSVERDDGNGGIIKTQVFTHAGFVEAAPWLDVYTNQCAYNGKQMPSPWKWWTDSSPRMLTRPPSAK